MSYLFEYTYDPVTGQRIWTEEETRYLLDHRNDSMDSLSDALDRKPQAIKSRFQILGIKSKKHPSAYRNEIFAMSRRGLAPSEISQELGIPRGTIWSYMKKEGININKKKYEYHGKI